jgi:hypothetical protein
LSTVSSAVVSTEQSAVWSTYGTTEQSANQTAKQFSNIATFDAAIWPAVVAADASTKFAAI